MTICPWLTGGQKANSCLLSKGLGFSMFEVDAQLRKTLFCFYFFDFCDVIIYYFLVHRLGWAVPRVSVSFRVLEHTSRPGRHAPAASWASALDKKKVSCSHSCFMHKLNPHNVTPHTHTAQSLCAVMCLCVYVCVVFFPDQRHDIMSCRH